MIPSIKPRTPWYYDPVTKLLRKLPISTRERRKQWAITWSEYLPSRLIRRGVWIYRKHTRKLLTSLKLTLAFIVSVLTHIGFSRPWAIAGGLAVFILHHWLQINHERREQERLKEEAKQELRAERRERLDTDPLT